MPELKVLLVEQLPSLRRYAAAFTGSRRRGDRYVTALVEAALADPSLLPPGHDFRLRVFRLLHHLFDMVNPPGGRPAADPYPPHASLNMIPAEQRAALLLVSLESFAYEQAARIIGCNGAKLCMLLHQARSRLAAAADKAASGRHTALPAALAIPH